MYHSAQRHVIAHMTRYAVTQVITKHQRQKNQSNIFAQSATQVIKNYHFYPVMMVKGV